MAAYLIGIFLLAVALPIIFHKRLIPFYSFIAKLFERKVVSKKNSKDRVIIKGGHARKISDSVMPPNWWSSIGGMIPLLLGVAIVLSLANQVIKEVNQSMNTTQANIAELKNPLIEVSYVPIIALAIVLAVIIGVVINFNRGSE